MSIFDRLTDTSLYTGAHKHRFDANGNGRGLAGRDRVTKGTGHIAGAPGGGGVADLSQITRTNLHTTGAGYIPPPSRGSSNGTGILYQRTSNDGSRGFVGGLPLSPTTPQRSGSVGRNAMRTSYTGTGAGAGYGLNPPLSSATMNATRPTSTTRASDSGQRRSSIFDRLNDVSSYTGAHKQRFSSDGRGRGAEGRTTANAYVSASANVMRR